MLYILNYYKETIQSSQSNQVIQHENEARI